MSKKAVRRVLAASALVGGLFVSQAASAAEDPNNPGLPDPLQYLCGRSPCVQYDGAVTVGVAGIERARQFVHVAATGNAALVGSTIFKRFSGLPAAELALIRELGLDAYDATHLDGSRQVITRFDNYVYALSPEGAPDAFGHFPPTRIRTVAFGSIPAEVTMHISQLRDQENLPVPLVATTFASSYSGSPGERAGNRNFDTKVTGEVSVRLSDLVVDGVPVDLGPDCKTGEPATLAGLRGQGFWREGVGAAPEDEVPDTQIPGRWLTTPYYTAPNGGLLSGAIDVPAFTNCGTGGEDLSPLLTAMASGPGNSLTIRQSPTGQCFPTGLGKPCEDDVQLPLPKEWHD